jgi:membrane protease YdiL (CAAX protease family)
MTHRARPEAGELIKHVALGLIVVVAVATPWSALVIFNARSSPHVPWAVPAGIAYVCLAAAYLNGVGWPRSTAVARRHSFRALPLTWVEFSWALLAGVAGVTSLWLLFAAAGQLSVRSPQGVPSNLDPVLLAGAVVIGAAVAAISEEGGLRGFMQAPLERLIGPVPAIATTSICFVLIHLTHGAAALAHNAPFYLAAGCIYGLLSYLTQSILPALLLHFVGDILTFGIRSSLVHLPGPQQTGTRGFLILCAILVAGSSVAAFFRLARMTASRRPHRISGEVAA